LSLDITFDTGLSISGLIIISRMDDIDLTACLNQIDEYLEQIPIILRFKLFQMWVLISDFRMNFGFYFNFKIFLDLDNDIMINSESLIKWFVFMEL